MKTTLNVDDELLIRAKRRAAERGTTLTRVVEDALRASLADEAAEPAPFTLELPIEHGHDSPAVDPADRDALYERMEPAG